MSPTRKERSVAMIVVPVPVSEAAVVAGVAGDLARAGLQPLVEPRSASHLAAAIASANKEAI
jgi:pyruvate/2-oxoglutarate/acetoin dehydrogenase E1 component